MGVLYTIGLKKSCQAIFFLSFAKLFLIQPITNNVIGMRSTSALQLLSK